MLDYRVHWKDYLTKYTKYKRAQFINQGPLVSGQIDLNTEKVYVYCCFMKPGAHVFMIDEPTDLLKNDYEIVKCITPVREEEIPICKSHFHH